MIKYNRMAALIYATYFYDKVCHDGRIALKKGYPPKINGVKLTSGLPFSQIGARDEEEDCTHFMSCCVGQSHFRTISDGFPIEIRGGGLRIGSPFRNLGVYGETYVPRLLATLRSLGATILQP